MESDDDRVAIELLGHVGPYTPYDPEDKSGPVPFKRPFAFGFQAPSERRSPKRPRSKKR